MNGLSHCNTPGYYLSMSFLVIIKSFENVPAVDADSILFLEDRSGFGRVRNSFIIFLKVFTY